VSAPHAGAPTFRIRLTPSLHPPPHHLHSRCSNAVIQGLGRIEAAAGGGASGTNAVSVPPEVLDHVGDADGEGLTNPDMWLQGRLQELLQWEKVRQVRGAALNAIAAKLSPGTGGGGGR
jgi:hypothetical protein